MEIKRDYKKQTKHRHWKIELIVNFHNLSPVIKLHGFSSKSEPKRMFFGKFAYLSDNRDDALSKEQELINNLYDYINESIKDQNRRIKQQMEYSNKTISKWEKFYEIPEIVGITRGEKLEDLFNESNQ